MQRRRASRKSTRLAAALRKAFNTKRRTFPHIKKKPRSTGLVLFGLAGASPLILAERVGFEPTVRLNVHWISSPAHSTTLPPFLFGLFAALSAAKHNSIAESPVRRNSHFLCECKPIHFRQAQRWAFPSSDKIRSRYFLESSSCHNSSLPFPHIRRILLWTRKTRKAALNLLPSFIARTGKVTPGTRS